MSIQYESYVVQWHWSLLSTVGERWQGTERISLLIDWRSLAELQWCKSCVLLFLTPQIEEPIRPSMNLKHFIWSLNDTAMVHCRNHFVPTTIFFFFHHNLKNKQHLVWPGSITFGVISQCHMHALPCMVFNQAQSSKEQRDLHNESKLGEDSFATACVRLMQNSTCYYICN